ncbi:hypothetical protein XarjCFBP8253_20145 [Xanthomonas arboricola pv. juglandis]|nr:hypothetical protein XarjCFBP8253_20145 [Xanthomonas arboricola pv. juglandis]
MGAMVWRWPGCGGSEPGTVISGTVISHARSYINSTQCANAFWAWLHHYNWHRPHASLGYKPLISRIPMNNVVGLHP